MSDTLPDSLVAQMDAAQDDCPSCLFCGHSTELDFDPDTLRGPLFFVVCSYGCGARGPTATTPEAAVSEYSPMTQTTPTP